MEDQSSPQPPPLPSASPIAPPLPAQKEAALACANCGRTYADEAQAFCPACGQRTPARRIDWGFLRDEILQKVLPADRGFVNSVLRLLWRPGHFIRGYVAGQRMGFTKPQIMVTMTAAMLLVWSRFLLGSAPFPELGSADTADAIANIELEIARWINSNFAAFSLLLLPVQALILRVAFWRKGGYNYPEWLVMTAFLIAQSNVLWALLLPLQKSAPQAVLLIALLTGCYNTFSLMQIFHEQSRWSVLLRSLAAYVVFVLTHMVAMAIVTAIALVVLGLPKS